MQLDVVSVGIVQGSSAVVLVLRAPHTGQLLVMEIGAFEGKAIALGMEKVEAPRPLTHDLLASTVQTLGAKVQKVFIRDFHDSAFYASLFLEKADGSVVEVDARPSDSVALALRVGAPVFCDPVVMALCGVNPDDAAEEDGSESEAGTGDPDGGETPIH